MVGVNLRRILELLGHKSVTTTERYSAVGSIGLHAYDVELALRHKQSCTKVYDKPCGRAAGRSLEPLKTMVAADRLELST